MSDVEKIAALHKYVISHGTYDKFTKNYDPTPRGLWYRQEAIGILKGKLIVCDGYTKLMGLLLTEAGFENEYVVGYAGGVNPQNAHSWNLVKVGGSYYHLDPTWNDEKGPFRFFLVSDKYLKSLKGVEQRAWNESDYPAASKGYYNDKPKAQ